MLLVYVSRVILCGLGFIVVFLFFLTGIRSGNFRSYWSSKLSVSVELVDLNVN